MQNFRGMNMMREKIALIMFCLCAVLLVGCEKVVDLTDEETQLIAEYAAELLLKYDINYVDRIDEGKQAAEELASEELEQTTSEESTTEVATSEESTEEKDSSEDSTTQDQTGDSSNSTEVVDMENPIGTESDIAIIAGIEGANITFREHVIVDKYPATDEQGEFIYLEASEGYQLLVLKFDVVNTTTDVLSVSLIDKELDYRIVCNDTKAAKPMLTILMDDLGTLETNIEPNVPQEAVLVFQISDGMQEELQTMDLYVTYNEMDNMINILQ